MSGENKKSEHHELKKDAVKGVFWAGSERAIRQIIQVVTSLTLARLLFPDDFGLMGMAVVFQGVAQLIADFGIGAAIVQQKEVDDLALDTAFWANLVVSSSLTALLILAAPWIGEFYGNDEVVVLITVLSLSLLVAGLRTIPRTLQYKAMEFNVIAKIGMFGSLTAAVVAITMAWHGFGVWSLVVQPILGNVIDMAGAWLAVKWRPRWRFQWDSITSLVHFSAGVLGTNLLNYANRNTDNLLIGKFLGSGQLGYYSLAYEIMLYPLSQVASVIVKVLFPTLSKMQEDMEMMRSVFLSGVSAIAMITFPMMFGLLAVSHEFIIVVFGEKWLPMEFVLQVFCIIGLLQSVSTTVGTIYLSTGNTKLMFKITAYVTPVIIIGFLIGVKWGIEGVAIAYAIISVITFFLSAHYAVRLIGLRLQTLLKTLTPVFIVALIMCVGVMFVLSMLPDDVQMLWRLILGIISGVILYPALSLLINRHQSLDLVGKVRLVFAR